MPEPAGPPSIGVFDSGVGGLSVLKALRAQLPHHDLIYVADSGHAPYGERSAEFITGRAETLSRFLVGHKVAAIVIACNTASVVASGPIRAWSPVPVVAMEPAIKPAVLGSHSKVIGVLATSRTLASASVSRLVAQFAGDVRVLLQPCPGLVEQVENGELGSASTRRLVLTYVQPLIDQGADTLVLGCTHYPFLRPLIQELAGPQMVIVDPAPAIARELLRRLAATAPATASATAQLPRAGQEKFYSSGPILAARQRFAALWHPDILVHPLPDRNHSP